MASKPAAWQLLNGRPCANLLLARLTALRQYDPMNADVENPVLAHLREIRADVAEIKVEVKELGNRVSAVECVLAELRAEVAHVHQDMADMNGRVDLVD